MTKDREAEGQIVPFGYHGLLQKSPGDS